MIEVVPITELHPRLSARRLLPCESCAGGRVELPLAPGPNGADAVALEASLASGEGPADFLLALDGALPAGLSLTDAKGRPLLDADGTARIAIERGRPTPLMLRYDDAFRGDDPVALRMTLTPVAKGLRGSTEVALELVPVAAPMRLVEDGHTGPDQTEAFSIPVTELGTGQGIFVAARGLRAPLEARHLSLESESDTPVVLSVQGDRILLTPEPRWWGCCVSRAGDYRFRLGYRNPDTRQAADLSGAVNVTQVPLWQRCWREGLVLLVIVLIAAKLVCLARRETFPRRSRILQLDEDAASWAGARKLPLHSRWRAFFLCGAERTKVYGFDLVARSGRAAIRRGKGKLSPSLYHAGLEEPLEDAFNERRVDEIPWDWTEEITDRDTGYRFVLIEDITRQWGDDSV